MAGLVKATIPCLVFVLSLLSSLSEATEFLLNNKHNSWAIPSSPDEYTNWAKKLRFEIKDTVVVEYDPKVDSILEVNSEDYKNCNRDNPIKSYDDGKTVIDLDRSGGFYFISGADGHCEKGQKLIIEVLSEKHSAKVPPPPQAISPSPSSSSEDADSPAPTPAVAARVKSDALSLRTSVGVFVVGLFMAMAPLVIFSMV